MKTNNELIREFFNGLQITNLCVLDYINLDEINENTTFDSLTEEIRENGGFDVEVIYYTTAVEFLSENDPSLRDSLELAADMGYSAGGLDSEILASLLASDMVQNEWLDRVGEINDFLSSLEW